MKETYTNLVHLLGPWKEWENLVSFPRIKNKTKILKSYRMKYVGIKSSSSWTAWFKIVTESPCYGLREKIIKLLEIRKF